MIVEYINEDAIATKAHVTGFFDTTTPSSMSLLDIGPLN
jgi:hypothetical protein